MRKYKLSSLLAHEFMHNYQHNYNPKYQILSTLGSINWKLEGHAEYISREFKGDGRLREKISKCKDEENKEHVGVPIFYLEDGTLQNLSYFKYSIVIQYLMEEKEFSFKEICELERGLDNLYEEILVWSEK